MKSSASEPGLKECVPKGSCICDDGKCRVLYGHEELVFPIIVRANFNACSEYMYIS